MTQPVPIPAATLIAMRDTATGPEILMVERARTMAFAGGALVFPGGRVDSGDVALAATLEGDPDDIAGRIAAVRETIEEAGIAIGAEIAAVAPLRARLHSGSAIGAVVPGDAWRLERLIPFARWIPQGLNHRIFDTRFYLASAPPGVAPEVDGSENVRAFWARAQDVLDAAGRGEASLIFPTRRNLERLARFACFAEAAADAAAHPIRAITPWVEICDGVEHLCIPDDLGYPVTSQPLASAVRA